MLIGLGRPNTDLILVNKAGRPVRREGPKWEPERLNTETLFILGSRANKVGIEAEIVSRSASYATKTTQSLARILVFGVYPQTMIFMS